MTKNIKIQNFTNTSGSETSSQHRYTDMNLEGIMTKGKFLTIAICIISIASCTKQEDPLAIFNIDTGLSIELSQNLSDIGGIPIIDIWTTESIDCSNAIINSQTYNGSQYSEILIQGFGYEGGTCTIGESQPHISLPIQSLSEKAHFFISIAGAGKLNGYVQKKNEEYSLNMETKRGINSRNNSIHRITENMAWGYFEISDNGINAEEAFSKINNCLLKYMDNDFIFENGDYTKFKILNSKVELSSVNATGQFKSFAIKAQKSKFGQLLIDLKAIKGIKGRVFTYTGAENIW